MGNCQPDPNSNSVYLEISFDIRENAQEKLLIDSINEIIASMRQTLDNIETQTDDEEKVRLIEKHGDLHAKLMEEIGKMTGFFLNNMKIFVFLL